MSLLNKNKIFSETRSLQINDPLINYQQVYEEMLLVEDHLSDQRLRCRKCIHKHLSKITALTKEAFSLDESSFYKHANEELQYRLNDLPFKVQKDNYASILQQVRRARIYLRDTILLK